MQSLTSYHQTGAGCRLGNKGKVLLPANRFVNHRLQELALLVPHVCVASPLSPPPPFPSCRAGSLQAHWSGGAGSRCWRGGPVSSLVGSAAWPRVSAGAAVAALTPPQAGPGFGLPPSPAKMLPLSIKDDEYKPPKLNLLRKVSGWFR